MVETTRQFQADDSFAIFDKPINIPEPYEAAYQPYPVEPAEVLEYDPSERDYLEREPAPLFLAYPQDARDLTDHNHLLRQRIQEFQDHQELPDYAFAAGSRRTPRASYIVAGLLGLSAVTASLAVFPIDSARAVIVNAMASLASVSPASSGTAQQEMRPTPRIADRQADAAPVAATETPIQPVVTASAAPSRDEIAAAYHGAIKARMVAAEPAVRETAPSARRIDPDQVAGLLTRARSLLAIGDIASARLLLERAADAQEAGAALMLAGTYDPQVLGAQDQRSIAPDPAMARLWYQKAAELGSADARRRLAQIEN